MQRQLIPLSDTLRPCPNIRAAAFTVARRSTRGTFSLDAYSSNSGTTNTSSSNVLEAFYWGRAFAEVLRERASAAATEFFSEVGQRDAERRQAIREFQEDVEARVREELQMAASQSSFSSNGSSAFGSFGQRQSAAPVELVKIPEVDIQEVVDELRAEIASARSTVQAYKLKTEGPAASSQRSASRSPSPARTAGNSATTAGSGGISRAASSSKFRDA